MTTKQKIGAGAALVIVLLLSAVPYPFSPPGGVRIILDHTHQVYVAPPCFEQANLTNYLTETTWSEAKARGYEPESACSEERMQPVRATVWTKLGEFLGAVRSPWPW